MSHGNVGAMNEPWPRQMLKKDIAIMETGFAALRHTMLDAQPFDSGRGLTVLDEPGTLPNCSCRFGSSRLDA